MLKFNQNKKSADGSSDRSKMYKVTCDNCGNACEVPFKPSGDRPVLCDNCFSKKRSDRPNRSGNRDFGRDKSMHSAVCDNCGDNCEVPFKPTSGKPVYCSKCFDQMGGSSDRGKGGSRGGSRGNDQLNSQFAALNEKLDKILEALVATPSAKTKAATKPKKTTTTKSTEKKTAKKPAAKKAPLKKKK